MVDSLILGSVVRLAPNRYHFYPANCGSVSTYIKHQANNMDTVDISNLVVGNPPSAFDPAYSTQQPSPESETLKTASESGELRKIQELLLSGSDKLSSDDLSSALSIAQQNGHLEVASYLLTCDAPIQLFNVERSILSNDYRFLCLFLEHGYDINTPINWNTPPLLIRSFDNEKLCNWLLDRGADPNAKCVLDLTPLSAAVQTAPFPIIKLLFNRGGSIEHGQLLHYAVRREHPDYLEVLQFILDKGPHHINRVMYENCRQSYELQKAFGIGTPLHEAAGVGKLDIVVALLARGADPAVKDPRGETAFDRAERNNRTVVMKCLRRLG